MIHLLLVIIYLAFISLGLPDALLGSAWPSMYREFSVPVSYSGIIFMIIAAGTIVSSLQSDRLTRRWGTGRVTAVSVLLTAAALFGFSVSGSFLALCLWAVPYGLGAGSVDAALNNYVALHYKSRHMSWLHCMWGIGASVRSLHHGACADRRADLEYGLPHHFIFTDCADRAPFCEPAALESEIGRNRAGDWRYSFRGLAGRNCCRKEKTSFSAGNYTYTWCEGNDVFFFLLQYGRTDDKSLGRQLPGVSQRNVRGERRRFCRFVFHRHYRWTIFKWFSHCKTERYTDDPAWSECYSSWNCRSAAAFWQRNVSHGTGASGTWLRSNLSVHHSLDAG